MTFTKTIQTALGCTLTGWCAIIILQRLMESEEGHLAKHRDFK